MRTKQLIGGGLCVMALAGLLVVTGCGNGHDHGDAEGGDKVKVTNATCPIMKMKVDQEGVQSDLVRDFHGKKIGFCCAECPPKWDELSDAKKHELVDGPVGRSDHTGHGDHGASAVMMTMAVNTKCPVMGGKVDPASVPARLVRMHKGQKVGFCCTGCPERWEELSDAEKDAKLAKVTSGGTKAALYTCSMHPKVRMTDPKAKCPLCGMDLIPVKPPRPAKP